VDGVWPCVALPVFVSSLVLQSSVCPVKPTAYLSKLKSFHITCLAMAQVKVSTVFSRVQALVEDVPIFSSEETE
jgi:hypothetical protein